MSEKKEAAENTAPVTATDPNEELVEYTAPLMGRTGDESMDIVVGVNGETIRIMRGETVKIKRKFLLVLQNAEEQELAAYRTMNAAQKASRKALADM